MSQRLLDYVLDDALDHFGYLGSKFESAVPDVALLAQDIQQHSEIWDNVFIPARWEIGTTPHWPAARHDLLLYIFVAFAPNSFMSAFFRDNALKPKEGTNPLVYAAHFNKDEHARTLLSRGARLDHRAWETIGFRQSLPIEVAFQNRHYAMITHFLEEGSTVPPHIFTDSFFKRNRDRDAPFCTPMIPSSIARVLVQSDDFVENINNCLSEAAWRAMKMSNQLLVFGDVTEEDLIAIIRRFIQVADEHFTQNSIGEAFLRFAVGQGYFSATQYLLTLGTPLPSDLLVTLHRHSGRWKTAPMIRFLVDNGADVLVHTSYRDTVLHTIMWAPGEDLYNIVHDTDEDDILGAVKLLVGYGCDPLKADSRGNTPLHIAVERGYISVARYLLTLGAPLPPHLLVTLNHDEWYWKTGPMIHFLVENGVNVLARASDGESVLHIVLWSLYDDNEALETVKLLVGHGYNALEANSRGITPLHIAIERGHISAARYLLTLGAHLPPDLFVALNYYWLRQITVSMIHFLVENGVDVLARTSDGDSVLHIALQSVYDEDEVLKTVKFLVGCGCNPLEANSLGNTPLYIAVQQDYISPARYLLTLGAPLPQDLLVALESRWLVRSGAPMIHFLVEHGFDVRARTSDGDSVLHIALRSLHTDNEAMETVKLLVGYGCNPLEANSHGDTPLHIVVERGYISVVGYLLSLGAPLPPDILVPLKPYWRGPRSASMIRFLVENGADALARASNGDSLLHTALKFLLNENEALEAVKLLVGYGCNPLEVNSYGKTPLHIAVERDHISVARYLLTLGTALPPDLVVTLKGNWRDPRIVPTIRFLVENGVDLNVLTYTREGDSVLHIALESLHDDNEAVEAVKLLVGYGCDPLEADSHGNTPLHIAVERGHISAARYLLSVGVPLSADPLVTSKNYWSVWTTALMIPFLVENGVDVLTRASNGDSVLHIALQSLRHDENKVLETVKCLVGYGCDPLEANSHGQTPLHIAVQQGLISVARYLLTFGAAVPPDLLVTLNRDRLRWSTAPMIRFLVENGADVLARTGDGASVLHITLGSSYVYNRDVFLETVKLLVAYGCDPLEANSYGSTPLHIAVERGHVSAARYLLSLGAPLPPDLLVTLNRDRSYWNTVPMIRFLVNNGADVHAHASDRDSVLHIALRCFNTASDALDAVKLLVSYGCDPLEANSRGETPLHIAAERSYVSVARYLITQGASVLTKVSNGGTVLHFAAGGVCPDPFDEDEDGCAQVEAIKFLVGCGCEPAAPNGKGETPLHISVDLGRIKTIKYLLSLNIPLPCDILFTAIQSDNNYARCRHIIATLVTSGCDTRTPNSDGDTPLRVAIMKGKVDVVEYLLSVASVYNPPLEDLLSATALAPPSVRSEMRRMLSARLTRSESPELRPAKRVRFS
jgi:ankyrin repeat protein